MKEMKRGPEHDFFAYRMVGDWRNITGYRRFRPDPAYNSRHKHISSLRSMRKPMQVAREGRLPYIERGRDRLF
jgi:hypothetical protein